MKPIEAFMEIDKFIFKSRASEDVHIKSAIGALGIRTDGAIIKSVNGSIRNGYAQSNATYSQSLAKSGIYHAEGRLLRKIDSGAVIYVARKRRDVLGFREAMACARPCEHCRNSTRGFRVKKIFYTIDENLYGIYYPMSDTDKICEF